MKKITKQEAYDVVLQAEANQGVVMGSELKELVRYFAPAIPKVVKTAEQWVSSACAKDDIREWPNYLHALGGWLYGTDGHRIHRAHTALVDGYYEPVTMLPATGNLRPFPIVGRESAFFPSAMPSAGVRFDSGEEVHGPNVKNCEQVRFPPLSGVPFDKRLLRQACNGEESTLLYLDSTTAYGHSTFGQFVIMGIKR